MKLKYYLIICLFFFGCSDQETILEAKSYLFIIAGQSNALGRASNDEIHFSHIGYNSLSEEILIKIKLN